MYKSHLCVIWKNESIFSLKATEEVKKNFGLNVLISILFTSNEKYSLFQKTKEKVLNNVSIYELEMFNRDRAMAYKVGFYLASKILGKCDQY